MVKLLESGNKKTVMTVFKPVGSQCAFRDDSPHLIIVLMQSASRDQGNRFKL
jgi:hypothetical protein